MSAEQVRDEARDDQAAARCLRSYATKFEKLHRDIADDFVRGAEALEERAQRTIRKLKSPRRGK